MVRLEVKQFVNLISWSTPSSKWRSGELRIGSIFLVWLKIRILLDLTYRFKAVKPYTRLVDGGGIVFRNVSNNQTVRCYCTETTLIQAIHFNSRGGRFESRRNILIFLIDIQLFFIHSQKMVELCLKFVMYRVLPRTLQFIPLCNRLSIASLNKL